MPDGVKAMGGVPLAHACPTHCKRCGKPIPDPRPNKRFCGKTCRAENCHERQGRRGGKTKPLQSAARGRSGRVRRKHGVDLYVLRDEVELIRALLTGKPAGSASARDRLAEKIPRALERIERKAV